MVYYFKIIVAFRMTFAAYFSQLIHYLSTTLFGFVGRHATIMRTYLNVRAMFVCRTLDTVYKAKAINMDGAILHSGFYSDNS